MTLQELKIVIKLVKGKQHKIEILPFLWVLFPDVRKFSTSEKKDLVTVWEANKSYPRILNRKHGRTYVISWLCFQFYIGFWALTEVGTVYPSGWDANKQNSVANLERYELLTKTEFYL